MAICQKGEKIMSVLAGDKTNWDRVKNAKPGDPLCYVNLDAIEALPDQFQATLGVVEFNKTADFTNVGSDKYPSWYPGTRIMYDICNKRGISSYGEMEVEAIQETVDISLMELSQNPCPMTKKTGYMIKKSGFVVQEDGTQQTVQEIGLDNAWDEAVKLWTKEELLSEGYTKTVEDKYHRKGYNSEWNGALTFHEYKYDTKYKRRSHFQDLFDKSFGMATTTAWLKVIRRLAGLKTGYTDEDLKEGKFYFAKITKSDGAIKAEAAARLSALSRGLTDGTQKASASLYGNPDRAQTPPASEPRNVTPVDPVSPAPVVDREPEPEQGAPTVEELAKQADPVVVLDQRLELQRVIEHYQKNALTPESLKDTAKNILLWLKSNAKATDDSVYWPKAIKVMTDIESSVPPEMRIAHGVK